MPAFGNKNPVLVFSETLEIRAFSFGFECVRQGVRRARRRATVGISGTLCLGSQQRALRCCAAEGAWEGKQQRSPPGAAVQRTAPPHLLEAGELTA